MNQPLVPLPLDGMRVVDFTRVLSGPLCTMTLGDMGADVIKVEGLPKGDSTRAMSPVIDGESYCFATVNRQKRSVALDFRSEGSKRALRKLVESADVVVENFRPGTIREMGLGYEEVAAVNPRVIYCSISGYGQDGPYSQRGGYDIVAQGLTGFLTINGPIGSAPAKVGIAITDVAAGVTAVQSILAAILLRGRTGRGQHIDVALTEAALSWTVWESAAFFGSGERPKPNGTRHRRAAPYQAYRAANGYLTIAANTGQMWTRLCNEVLGRPDIAADPRFKTKGTRLAHVDELEAAIEETLSTAPVDTWVAKLNAAGIPSGPVREYHQIFDDPHLSYRGVAVRVDHPVLGGMTVLSSPLGLNALAPVRRAPLLGEHTREVLAEVGLTAAEIDSVVA